MRAETELQVLRKNEKTGEMESTFETIEEWVPLAGCGPAGDDDSAPTAIQARDVGGQPGGRALAKRAGAAIGSRDQAAGSGGGSDHESESERPVARETDPGIQLFTSARTSSLP